METTCQLIDIHDLVQRRTMSQISHVTSRAIFKTVCLQFSSLTLHSITVENFSAQEV